METELTSSSKLTFCFRAAHPQLINDDSSCESAEELTTSQSSQKKVSELREAISQRAGNLPSYPYFPPFCYGNENGSRIKEGRALVSGSSPRNFVH